MFMVLQFYPTGKVQLVPTGQEGRWGPRANLDITNVTLISKISISNSVHLIIAPHLKCTKNDSV
jgi:hypothetical protein